MQPVIKWSGSKRSQANIIKSYVPSFNTYYEPFIGGGSILYALHPQKAICGDIYEPLINLWNEIKNNPQQVADEYKKRWLKLQDLGEDFYYQIRKQFNQSHSIYDFLFLSRTCTNGLIRFNKKGEFNTSFHFSRKAINPSTLENIINDWSKQLQNTVFINGDYEYTTSNIKENDFVYLDPPYANTKGMYFGTIDYNKFFTFLETLNKKNVKFILSFNGKRGNTNKTFDVPKDLYKRHEYIKSGISSFNRTKQSKIINVQEYIYLNY